MMLYLIWGLNVILIGVISRIVYMEYYKYEPRFRIKMLNRWLHRTRRNDIHLEWWRARILKFYYRKQLYDDLMGQYYGCD